MTQQVNNASELHKAEKVVRVILPAGHQSTKVLKPGKQPFDFPAASAATQRSAILRLFASVPGVRRNQIDVALTEKPGVESIAVVGAGTIRRWGASVTTASRVSSTSVLHVAKRLQS
jgi:hypothetical protein